MISVFIGPPDVADRLSDVLAAHAEWVGCHVEDDSAEVAEGLVAHAAWDPRSADDANRLFVACPDETRCRYEDALGDRRARIRIHLNLAGGSVRAEAPIGAAAQVLHASFAGGWLLTDDLRLARCLLQPALDETGLLALLKWGMAPAPFTIFRGIERLVPGTAVTYDGRSRSISTESMWREVAGTLHQARRPESRSQAKALLAEAVDATLAHVEPGTAVLFSGGTDSPFLASRLAGEESEKVALVHLEFDGMPEETRVARAIADHLRLPLHQRMFDPRHAVHVLEHAGKEWSFPFSDSSMVPGHAAVAYAFELGSRLVVDGTGVTFAPMKAREWTLPQRVVPPIATGLALKAYRSLGIWRRSGSLEKTVRAMARIHGVPMPHAVTVQNMLDGIAYQLSTDAVARIAAAMDNQILDLPGGRSGIESFNVARFTHTHANRWIPKLAGPAESRGGSVLTPFLTDRVMVASLTTLHGEWMREHKALLRMALAERVPSQLVYRPKSAFMAPDAMFQIPEIRAAVESAVEPGEPLASFVRMEPVRWLMRHAARGNRIPTGHATFLWGLAFSGQWLRGMDFRPPDFSLRRVSR